MGQGNYALTVFSVSMSHSSANALLAVYLLGTLEISVVLSLLILKRVSSSQQVPLLRPPTKRYPMREKQQIDLIDGEEFINKLIECGLGVKEKTIYEVDKTFFEKV